MAVQAATTVPAVLTAAPMQVEAAQAVKAVPVEPVRQAVKVEPEVLVEITDNLAAMAVLALPPDLDFKAQPETQVAVVRTEIEPTDLVVLADQAVQEAAVVTEVLRDKLAEVLASISQT